MNMSKALLCAAIVALTCTFAIAQQYKVLHTFTGGPHDGVSPMGDLVFDHAGNLYGTTRGGGSGVGFGGTVFELSPNADGTWTETIVYNFCSNQCLDGSQPEAGLTIDSTGNLYGTTYSGGLPCPGFGGTCGTVFELSPPSSPGGAWTETVLHNFCTNVVNGRCLDGNYPHSRLTLDATGNLYGTTTWGGTGHLDGGENAGVVFELSPGANGWTETVLYNFCSLGQDKFCPDGAFPVAGVTFDKAGNLYGTTGTGGATRSAGGGTVYRLVPGAGQWTETVLYAFAFQPFTTGAGPGAAVSFDSLGNLYSTVEAGGQFGVGGVFRLSPKGGGSEQTLSFNGRNGSMPVAGVLMDSRHPALFGTTKLGGDNGFGTIFKIIAPAQESVLYSFCSQSNCPDGGVPVAGLVEENNSGNLYGTASQGGINNQGVVFEIVQ